MPLTEAVFVSKYSSLIAKVRVWICVCRLQQGHRIRFSFCVCTMLWFFTNSYSEMFFTKLMNYIPILIIILYSCFTDTHKVTNQTIWI